MRPIRFVAVSLFAVSLVAASVARADDKAPPAKPPAEGAKPGDAPKKDDAKKDEVLRVERAKKLVKELEDAIARVKAATPIDALLLQNLMEALDRAKTLASPAKPEELTADEKKAVLDEAKKQGGADSPPANDPLNDWQEKAITKAFEGADLSEEETIKAKKIVGEWWKENLASTGDSKKQSDLKRKRDDDLEKAVGKKARKIINNLNAMGPGRR
jgi:hypothetical protein